ncbi:MAG: TIGR00282 family metallophosphoesterase [Eubacteriales bacterium]|nr:TIGR00282 family metallophosphoesterase [Eubacteriales bacterium]
MQSSIIRILALGDVVGKSGVGKVADELRRIKAELKADVVLVNGENASESNGLDVWSAETLLAGGTDVITGGNHTIALREIFSMLDDSEYLVRPANFPPLCPGRGYTVFRAVSDIRILIINAAGQVFMPPGDNPFVCVDRILRENEGKYDIAVADFHGEATSEKSAFGLWFDGRIQCIYGTHTHIPTADETLLPKGSGYITDIGMCGVREGTVLGVKAETVIKQFVTGVHERFERITGKAEINGVLFEVDYAVKRCLSIKRIKYL